MTMYKIAFLSMLAAASAQVVSQISDGQVQAPTGKASSSTAPRVVTQISDGQVQAPAATSKTTSMSSYHVASMPTTTLKVTSTSMSKASSTSTSKPMSTSTTMATLPSTSRATSMSTSKASSMSSSKITSSSMTTSTSTSKATSASTLRMVTQISDGQIQAPAATGKSGSSSASMAKSSASAVAPVTPAASGLYKYVALFSVDGMHASDLTKYIADRPNSTFAHLLQTAYNYADADTTAPSDSFPGTAAQYTGAGSGVSGIYYDVTYDRVYWAAGSNCTGPPGAITAYDETIDYNSTELFSGGIDPANLAETLVNGKCTPIYPHQRLLVNTIMEVARSHGLETAYTDKHPAYDLLRGPSGTGLTTGYFPEIAAVGSTIADVIAYDQYHVNAFLDWLDVVTPAHSEGKLSKVPSIFGGNFQSFNVAEKNKTIGGYLNQTGLPFNTGMLQALDSIDGSLGDVVAKLKTKQMYDDTLVVVCSKHGQAPINRTLYNTIDPDLIVNLTGVPVAFFQNDDIGLIYLNNSADTAKATANLNTTAARKAGHILSVISGANLTASGYGQIAPNNSRIPDIIVQPTLGTIYTTSTKKISEHGGLSDDDRHVACFASNPKLKAQTFSGRVNTTQVAPLVLKALGLNPYELLAVQKTGVTALPGF